MWRSPPEMVRLSALATMDARHSIAASTGNGISLNLAYFNGYAMWTYHATPFVFGEPGYEARDVAPIENAGETLRGVAVRFPEGVHPRVLSVIFLKGAASASCATCRARAAPGRRAR